MGQWGSELLERVKRVCIILKLGVAELHLPTVNHFKPAFVTLWLQCILFNNINRLDVHCIATIIVVGYYLEILVLILCADEL